MAPVDFVKVVFLIKPFNGSRSLCCKVDGGLISYAGVENGSIKDNHSEIPQHLNIEVDEEINPENVLSVRYFGHNVHLIDQKVPSKEKTNLSNKEHLKKLPDYDEEDASEDTLGLDGSDENEQLFLIGQCDEVINVDKQYIQEVSVVSDSIETVENVSMVEEISTPVCTDNSIMISNKMKIKNEVYNDVLSTPISSGRISRKRKCDQNGKKLPSPKSTKKKTEKKKQRSSLKGPVSENKSVIAEEEVLFKRKGNPTNVKDMINIAHIDGITVYVCELCGFYLPIHDQVELHVKKRHALVDGKLSRKGLLHKVSPNKIQSDAAKALIDLQNECHNNSNVVTQDSSLENPSQEEVHDIHVLEDIVMECASSSDNVGKCTQKADESIVHQTSIAEKNSYVKVEKISDESLNKSSSADISSRGNLPSNTYDCYKRSVLEAFVDHHFDSLENLMDTRCCKYCDWKGSVSGDDIYKLIDHGKKKHSKFIGHSVCMDCMMYFLSRPLLRHHMDTVHSRRSHSRSSGFVYSSGEGDITSLVCKVCEIYFVSVRRFETHMIQNHSVTHKYKCEVEGCNFIGSSYGGFCRHSRIHSVKKEEMDLQICELCGYSTKLRSRVILHQAKNCPGSVITDSTNLSELNIICKACNKRFASENIFNLHNKEVHCDPHKCPYENCTKAYVDKRALSNHISRIHLQSRVYLCGFCNMQLSDRSALTLHVKTVHEKIKDFVCTWQGCNKKFGRKNNLQNHYKQHLGEKKLVCEYCKFKSVQRASMNYHMKQHHPQLPYNR